MTSGYNKNSPLLYFPRPFFFKRHWRDEDDVPGIKKVEFNQSNPDLSEYEGMQAGFIDEVHVEKNGAYFGRSFFHWFICFGIISTFVLWTVVLAMDFSHVFSPYNHYESLAIFANSTTHPRSVLDTGLVLQLPHKLVWYIMWCVGYAMSGVATIIVFFHITGSLPAFKNIFHDVGVFFPIFNLFAALGEMSLSLVASEDLTEQQIDTYWKLAQTSTGILFFGTAYVFVFCRQRRTSINVIVWQASVGFVNILMFNSYVAFALVTSCRKSLISNVHPTAASGVAFVLLGTALLLFIADLTATFWYRTVGVYSSLSKDEGWNPNNYPDVTQAPVDYLFKWTPSIYNVLMPAIYFGGLLAAWKDDTYDWASTALKYRSPVIAAAIMGIAVFSLLTLFIAGRAFAKYQHERNEENQRNAAVHIRFQKDIYEVGVDLGANLRI